MKKNDYPGDPEGEPTAHLISHFLIPLDIYRKKKKKETGSCIDMCSNPNFYIA